MQLIDLNEMPPFYLNSAIKIGTKINNLTYFLSRNEPKEQKVIK